MRDFKRLIRVLLYLFYPSAEGFSIHLRRYFQIARQNLLYDTGVDFFNFRNVNGPSHNKKKKKKILHVYLPI